MLRYVFDQLQDHLNSKKTTTNHNFENTNSQDSNNNLDINNNSNSNNSDINIFDFNSNANYKSDLNNNIIENSNQNQELLNDDDNIEYDWFKTPKKYLQKEDQNKTKTTPNNTNNNNNSNNKSSYSTDSYRDNYLELANDFSSINLKLSKTFEDKAKRYFIKKNEMTTGSDLLINYNNTNNGGSGDNNNQSSRKSNHENENLNNNNNNNAKVDMELVDVIKKDLLNTARVFQKSYYKEPVKSEMINVPSWRTKEKVKILFNSI
jgi:hypothetical protein